MAEEVKAYLRKLLNYVNGLHAIVISDRDGVPMLKVADEHAPELALRPAYLSAFSHMTDQASKIGMGSNQSIIAFYDNIQVVQLNKHPLTVTFIAEANATTGEMLNLELDLKDILVDLRRVNEMQQQ
ncbi:ragulator complex protein LAMTOR3-A-like [Babylonia areolata]|uniref:ragulator complex protein LAMTOR3-A-like n=1 Tax=Babylonia areolata TaxID=304850 RepID=UPI003FD0A81E